MTKKCVMVTGIGNNDWMLAAKKYAYPVIQKYFQQNGHEVFLIEETPFQTMAAHPSWLWLKCHEILPNYEYILSWNLDILPVKFTDDIFHDLDFNLIGACEDLEAANVRAGCPQFSDFKYNCGLVGVPNQYKDFCTKVFDMYKHNPYGWPSYEQYYVNKEITQQNIPIHHIPNRFNYYYLYNDFEKASCWHYTNRVSKQQVSELFKYHYLKYF